MTWGFWEGLTQHRPLTHLKPRLWGGAQQALSSRIEARDRHQVKTSKSGSMSMINSVNKVDYGIVECIITPRGQCRHPEGVKYFHMIRDPLQLITEPIKHI